MKRKIVVLMCGMMLLSLVACGKTAEQSNDKADTQTEKVKVTAAAKRANPWTISDKRGIYNATGFNMEAPQGATKVSYSYMAKGLMAQLSYVYEDVEWVYRIQPTGQLKDISGMNYDWISDEPGEVAGFEAEYLGYSKPDEDSEFIDDLYVVQVVNWYDDETEVTHSLSASGTNLDGMDIQVYAEELYAVTMRESD